MPQMIKIGGGLFSKGELLRINPGKNTIEESTNDGRLWSLCCANSTSYDTFRDLIVFGREMSLPLPVASTSPPIPPIRSQYVVPTRAPMETPSASRSMAASCLPTPARGCTTSGMEEEEIKRWDFERSMMIP